MVPADRRLLRRLGSAAGAAAISSEGGLSVRRNSMLKRAGSAGPHARAEDDGFRLDDEVLITILSLVGSTADLVRCAAACRRWRRLVSTNAAFICRHAPRLIPSKSFIRFFDLNNSTVDATSSAPRPLWLGKPLLGGLVRGYGHRMLDASSRVVASRGGLLAAEIRRAESGGSALRLRVCNPASGEVDCLPCLRGNDRPGPYACALLTADDLQYFQDATPPPCSAASYRLLLVYNRGSFTAARCFSSDAGGWGPEAQVSGARVGRAQLHATRSQATRAAIVHRGIVFWPRLRLALLALPTEGAAVVRGLSTSRFYDREGSMLGLMPDGKLCWVELVGSVMRVSLRSHNVDMLCLRDGTLKGSWLPPWKIGLRLMPEFSSATSSVTPRWFYEKSGTIFVTAKIGHGVGAGERCYGFYQGDLPSIARWRALLHSATLMYGYELDPEKFLGSLSLSLGW